MIEVFNLLSCFFSIQLFGQDNYSIRNIISEYPKDSFFVGGTFNHAELNSKIEKLFLKEFKYIYDSNLKPKKAVEILKNTLKDKNTSPVYFD